MFKKQYEFLAHLKVNECDIIDGQKLIVIVKKGWWREKAITARIRGGEVIYFATYGNSRVAKSDIKSIYTDEYYEIDDKLICSKIENMVYDYEDCMDLHEALITLFESKEYKKIRGVKNEY